MIQDEIRKYIAENQLIETGNRLLLAVSGGGDSMAMLNILHGEGYYCEVAHVNFKLRGDDSDCDEALVTSVCHDKGIKLHSMQIDTHLYAQENKQSIEMAAREIRYNFFDDLMDEHKLDFVVVAHHRDDVVETFFINLMRGTGLRGLSGIAPKNGRIIRPFLSVSHQELITYLEDRKLDYRTDETNFDTTILRNELRQHIIPHFEEKKNGFSEIMLRTVGRLRQSEVVVKAFIKEWIEKNVKVNGEELLIPKAALYSSVSPSEILFHMLQPKGFSIAVIDEIASQSEWRVGARFDAQQYRLIVDRDYFIVDSNQTERASYSIEQKSYLVEHPMLMAVSLFPKGNDFELIKDKKVALLDAEALIFPLTLRHWQEGDVFCPIGMKGKQKKVSDYFINQKFSIPQKEKIWLLCSGKHIVWVVGHRLDERYKVTNASEQILSIKLL